MTLQGTLKLDRGGTEVIPSQLSTQPELAVILSGKNTYLLKRETVEGVQLFQKIFIQNGLRVCLINEPLDVNMKNIQAKSFEKVIKLLQGQECSYQKSRQVYHLLEVIDFLKVFQLRQSLVDDFLLNFEDYGFFFLFEIAERFGIKELKEKCLQSLMGENFEQLNYNRYDLMVCPEKQFIRLIKMHKKFVDKEMIQGLKDKNIDDIVKQYHQYNDKPINFEDVLSVSSDMSEELRKYQKFMTNQNHNLWQKFNTRSFEFLELCESIRFGSSGKKENYVAVKCLRRTSCTDGLSSSVSSINAKQNYGFVVNSQNKVLFPDSIKEASKNFCDQIKEKADDSFDRSIHTQRRSLKASKYARNSLKSSQTSKNQNFAYFSRGDNKKQNLDNKQNSNVLVKE